MPINAIWEEILKLQEELYPNWRTKKPRLLYSTALAGEVGEICGVITHLDGGGTNSQHYTERMVLGEAADTFIQLVLLLERSGFGRVDFESALIVILRKLKRRMKHKGVSS